MDQQSDLNKKLDLVRPGEQWFFYWKTSAALWESRILATPLEQIIFIPLYWGFHAESPTQWDFGEFHPERDLRRLTELLTQHRRKFCWLLPLSPAPFLPNGGVPVSGAKTLSISHDGVHLSSLDQEGKLHKMFSFFEPKVFSGYGQFLKAFGNFLATYHVKAPVWGVDFYYLEEEKNVSFMQDSSFAFEQGFSRYLKSSYPQGVDLTDPKKEEELKRSFTSEVSELFKSTAESALSPFWGGVQKIHVLGSGPKDTILRSIEQGKGEREYFDDLFYHYLRNEWISSALLGPSEKKSLLTKALDEHFGPQEIEERFHYHLNRSGITNEWRPYGLMDIFDNHDEHFIHNGLLNFLDERYRYMYQVHQNLNFTTEWIEQSHHKVKFFHGGALDRTRFAQMLKLFLMGQNIIFDKTGLHPDLEKRLQIFYLENNLKIQSVNFLTAIHLCELGEGKLFAFEGDKLQTSKQKSDFWSQLFKFLNLVQPEILMDKDVFSLWRIRETSSQDLNFLDVRRINLYNPTSYKKLVTIHTQKHFAYLKMIDPERAQAKSTPEGVEIELLPSGKIALDFGHYEERS